MFSKTARALLLALSFTVVAAFAKANQKPRPGSDAYVVREVHHQLVMLPYYTVFDHFQYKVEGTTVELSGYVTNPSLKAQAGKVVKGIEGVEKVENNIKVLPPSSSDDAIRLKEYRAIYGFGPLQKYSLQAVGPIHIIVNSGHVTLYGVVDNKGDKQMAYTRANGVSGVFSVTDNLQVESQQQQQAADNGSKEHK